MIGVNESDGPKAYAALETIVKLADTTADSRATKKKGLSPFRS